VKYESNAIFGVLDLTYSLSFSPKKKYQKNGQDIAGEARQYCSLGCTGY
jgi:hypothetical protein